VPAVAKLFGTLTAAAQEMMPALPLEIVRKKINVSDAVAWEHEQVPTYPIIIQFSRKDILAVTLSGHATHDPSLRATLLDRTVDPAVLSRNIVFVANTIAKVLFFFLFLFFSLWTRRCFLVTIVLVANAISKVLFFFLFFLVLPTIVNQPL